MSITPYKTTGAQLPAPPDKQMYRSDPSFINMALNLSKHQDASLPRGVLDPEDGFGTKTVDVASQPSSPNPVDKAVSGTESYDLVSINSNVQIVEINGVVLQFHYILSMHGWLTIVDGDETKLPFVVRDDGNRYVPLGTTEKTLLSPYCGPYPEKQLGRPPMRGFYLTTAEVRLLNRFVNQSYTQALGLARFSLKDMLVDVYDLIDFYQRAKSLASTGQAQPVRVAGEIVKSVQGGWSQINNTIVPYVLRNRVKMVPLSVIRYAAGLLNNVDVPSLDANLDECAFLNQSCAEQGLNFQFRLNTKLIELFLVPTLSDSKVSIIELPNTDPMQHARFLHRYSDRRSVFVAASVSKKNTKRHRAGSAPEASPVGVGTLAGQTAQLQQPQPVPRGEIQQQQYYQKLEQQQQQQQQQPQQSPQYRQIQQYCTQQPPPQQYQQLKQHYQQPPKQQPQQHDYQQPKQPQQQQRQQQCQQQQISCPEVTTTGQPVSPDLEIKVGIEQAMIKQTVNVCPQHGIRTVLIPQSTIPCQSVVMTQSARQPDPPASVDPQPALIIRLDRPVPAGIPLPVILPPSLTTPVIIQPPIAPEVKENDLTSGQPPVVIKIESDDDDDSHDEKNSEPNESTGENISTKMGQAKGKVAEKHVLDAGQSSTDIVQVKRQKVEFINLDRLP